jgi:hypothetical protein
MSATTVYGVNYTKYRNAAVLATAAGTLIGPNQWNGSMRYDSYTSAAEESGSLIYLGILRQGETFMGGHITAPLIVTSGTIIVGDGGYTDLDGNAVTADTDRYLASTSVGAALAAQLIAQAGIGFSKLGPSKAITYADPIDGSRGDLGIYATTGGATYGSSKLIEMVMHVNSPAT